MPVTVVPHQARCSPLLWLPLICLPGRASPSLLPPPHRNKTSKKATVATERQRRFVSWDTEFKTALLFNEAVKQCYHFLACLLRSKWFLSKPHACVFSMTKLSELFSPSVWATVSDDTWLPGKGLPTQIRMDRSLPERLEITSSSIRKQTSLEMRARKFRDEYEIP